MPYEEVYLQRLEDENSNDKPLEFKKQKQQQQSK